MNILMIAEPTTSHNQKRINYLAKQGYKCFVMPITLSTKQVQFQWTPIYPKEKNVSILTSIYPFSLKYFYRTIKTLFIIKSIVKKYNIEVLFIQYTEPGALWGIFSKFFGVKTILSSQGTDVLKTIPNFYKRDDISAKITQKLYRKAFSLADYIVATSYSQIHSIEKFILPNKLKNFPQIIRTGIDIDKIEKAKDNELPKEVENKHFILFPRNMKPLYNHTFCLEAIKLLSKEIRNKYYFVFLDRDRTEKEYINKIEDTMNTIEAKFIFLPQLSQSELHSLFKKCELVIMTPLSDGSPVSAMEALYFEKPLILGPIEYDKDIFSSPVIQLTQWSTTELSILIDKIINDKSILMDKSKNRIIKYCNMNKEFEKLNQIILSLNNTEISLKENMR